MPPSLPRRLPRLFVVRHGDTAWSDSGQHTGRTDIPLNDSGERRARFLAARLGGETFAAVFTSPLARAQRTCELAGFGSRAHVNADLVEWDYGAYEGLTSAEIEKDRPGWNLFRDGAPHGESPEQAAARADRFVELVRSVDGDVVAFSSGHIIRMIAARWLLLAPLAAQRFLVSTASVGILSYEHQATRPVVERWNDVRVPDEKS